MTSVIASLALLVGMLGVEADVPHPQLAAIPGTYELLICKGSCSLDEPGNVLVRGLLVLAADPFTPDALNSLASMRFERAYGIGGDPNGCFSLSISVAGQTYAGLIEHGLTLWRVNKRSTHIRAVYIPRRLALRRRNHDELGF